jgi:hypothetical protein
MYIHISCHRVYVNIQSCLPSSSSSIWQYLFQKLFLVLFRYLLHRSYCSFFFVRLFWLVYISHMEDSFWFVLCNSILLNIIVIIISLTRLSIPCFYDRSDDHEIEPNFWAGDTGGCRFIDIIYHIGEISCWCFVLIWYIISMLLIDIIYHIGVTLCISPLYKKVDLLREEQDLQL